MNGSKQRKKGQKCCYPCNLYAGANKAEDKSQKKKKVICRQNQWNSLDVGSFIPSRITIIKQSIIFSLFILFFFGVHNTFIQISLFMFSLSIHTKSLMVQRTTNSDYVQCACPFVHRLLFDGNLIVIEMNTLNKLSPLSLKIVCILNIVIRSHADEHGNGKGWN